MTRCERADESHAEMIERLQRELKTVQEVYQSGNEDSLERLEDLAKAGSTVDPKTMIEAMQGMKAELSDKFISRDDQRVF